MRLLLVEDDEMIAESVQRAMAQHGYAVDNVRNARDAKLSVATHQYDLALLDLGLPDGDGITLLQQWRRDGFEGAVIILTARDAVEDRILGLDSGADDYLLKPFDLNELGARVRALLRRRTGQSQPSYQHGDLLLDPAAHEVRFKDAIVALVPREFALLHALIEEPTRVFRRDQLEEKLYGWGREIGSNAIEVHVHALRRKLGADQIVTVRGVGYRLKAVT
jgi:two-component system response regulator QseB